MLPAQLRFRDEAVFRDLFVQAGLGGGRGRPLEEARPLPSARWIADHIAFAPGMAAMVHGLGSDRARVLDARSSAIKGRGK